MGVNPNRSSRIPIIAAGISAAAAVLQAWDSWRLSELVRLYAADEFEKTVLLEYAMAAALVFLAVMLLARRRDAWLFAAAGAIIAAQMLALVNPVSARFVGNLVLVTYIVFAAFTSVFTVKRLEGHRDAAKKLWYLPGVLAGAVLVLQILFNYGAFAISFSALKTPLFLLAARWMAHPEGVRTRG